MMVGRKKDVRFLEEEYASPNNSLVILYGRQGTGKTTLATEFLKSKNGFYYCCKECSEREQHLLMREEWKNGEGLNIEEEGFEAVLKAAVAKAPAGMKLVLVIDEVYNAVRQGKELTDALANLLEDNKGKNNIMIILSSSSVQWVENKMVKEIGALSHNITGFRKLLNFGFLEIVNRFPKLDSKTCVYIYGILGGVPGYVDMWDADKSVKENVMKLFLDKNALFYREPERFLKSELRELSFYNTILSNLASDREKLNYLYQRTGFSRAKISVYIKNLIQLDTVEKIFSMEKGNYDNIQKGLYGIKDPFMHFWYRFVFPNLSLLETGDAEYVYDKLIEPYLNEYMQKYFVRVCKEYLDLMNAHDKLPVSYDFSESWYGKENTIDIIVKDRENDRIIAALCKWSDDIFDETDFEKLISASEYAGIHVDYYYMFSKEGFSEAFEERCKLIDNITLIGLDSF